MKFLKFMGKLLIVLGIIAAVTWGSIQIGRSIIRNERRDTKDDLYYEENEHVPTDEEYFPVIEDYI